MLNRDFHIYNRYQDQLKSDLNEEVTEYVIEARRLRELRFAEDLDILLTAKFIGMTTTGAARYRRVLKDVGCPIVLIEEAAEVIFFRPPTSLLRFNPPFNRRFLI